MSIQVRPLEWSDDEEGGEPVADWVGGRYWARAEDGKHELRVEYVGSGQMYQKVLGTYYTIAEAKAVAQADYEQHVLSCLKAAS